MELKNRKFENRKFLPIMTTGLLPRQVESQDIEETQKKENEERLKNFKLLIEKAQPKSESISEASKSVSNSEDNKNPPKGIGEYNPFPELQTKPNEIVASRHASNRIRGIEIRPS